MLQFYAVLITIIIIITTTVVEMVVAIARNPSVSNSTANALPVMAIALTPASALSVATAKSLSKDAKRQSKMPWIATLMPLLNIL